MQENFVFSFDLYSIRLQNAHDTQTKCHDVINIFARTYQYLYCYSKLVGLVYKQFVNLVVGTAMNIGLSAAVPTNTPNHRVKSMF